MAVDTAVTAQTGAAALGGKVVMYQRLIDFSVTNLGVSNWFDLFQMPANALVIGGMAELVLQGTASATFDIGVEGGAQLLSATALDASTGTVTAFTATTGVVFDGTTIDLSINTAEAVLGKVRVTAIVALCDAM
jgi:hypothetical protein